MVGRCGVVFPTSGHSRRDVTGGIRYGCQYAGRWFPRCHDETCDAGEPSSSTPGGRPAGASTPQHVASRPSVPDLCIASANLLSLIDPLPMDRLSRHTVAAICSWPAVDRHNILAVANRDVRVARQNLAELQLYVDDHAAYIANCASAGGNPSGTRRGRQPINI